MTLDASTSLQFDRADYGAAAPAGVICDACRQPVSQSYYTAGQQIVCSSCREKHAGADRSKSARFFCAAGAALLVAMAGAAVWWGVRAMAHYQLAIIAIGIGYGVGRAITWGTGGRTNRAYQFLALFITYTGIALNYVPDLVKTLMDEHMLTPGTLFVAVVVSYALPFAMGFKNIIGFLIIAFGLREAWKHSRPHVIEFSGPFSASPAPPVLPSANG